MNIPDFAVSSQEAGFDKFLKVYNEYFKFDFFGNANFYGAKNGENYQTGQAWITPITPSQAIALLTNQTTDKMNTLANTCFQYDGSDDSKNIIRIMNKNHRGNFTGNDKYFYWIANDIADTFYKMDKDLTEIPPYDYLALLTGKQLTEWDLIVGNRFECIEAATHHDFMKGNIYDCMIEGSITNGVNGIVRISSESFLNRHFIRAIKEEKMEILKQTDIAEVCEQVINATPSVWINSNGADETTCPFCHAKIYEAVGDMGELPHNNNCAYLIAKDLKTRYNGNTK